MIKEEENEDMTNRDLFNQSELRQPSIDISSYITEKITEKYEEKLEPDTDARYRLNKEEKKLDQLEAKKKNFKKKKIQSMAKSNSIAYKLNQRIKYIDILIGILVIINFSISLYENDQYTSGKVEVVCNDTTLRDLTYNYPNSLIVNGKENLNFSSVDDQLFRYLGSNGTINVPPKPSPLICVNSTTTVIKEPYQLTDYISNLRSGVIIVIIINEILLIYRYFQRLRLMKETYLACDKDNLISTGLLRPFCLEFLVLVVFVPPYTQGFITGEMLFGYYLYSYDSIINIFQIFKLYYVIKIFLNFSRWTQEDVKNIGVENKLKIGAIFALKAQIRHRPLLTIFLLMATSAAILGFLFRMFEYGYISRPGDMRTPKALQDPNYNGYSDTYWFILITMMLVGYGDIYPQTQFGRVVAFITIIIGMMIVSLFVVSLNGMIEFSTEEGKAHTSILKMFDKKKMEKSSVVYIKSLMKLFLMKKSRGYLMKEAFDKRANSHFRTYINQVLIVKENAIKFNNSQKVASSHSVPVDEMLNRLHQKLENDTDIVGPLIYVLEDMNLLSNKIIENENHIKNGLDYLKNMQDDMISYLVKFNTIKSTVEMIEQENPSKQENPDLI